MLSLYSAGGAVEEGGFWVDEFVLNALHHDPLERRCLRVGPTHGRRPMGLLWVRPEGRQRPHGALPFTYSPLNLFSLDIEIAWNLVSENDRVS